MATQAAPSLPRPDYPRPQFMRDNWLNLNGAWAFDYDDAGAGDRERWYEGHEYGRTITVPFCFQSALSGIGETGFHDTVWYSRKVTVPESFRGKRTILHFGAVDYLAWVWVNSRLVRYHEGGHTPFSADITDVLEEGENTITVKAQDFSRDMSLPRGKQYWKEKSVGIFYTRTTGIWQTVWLEAVPHVYLREAKYTPHVESREIAMQLAFDGFAPGSDVRLNVRIGFEGRIVAEDTVHVRQPVESRRYTLREEAFWSPEHPHLYDVTFTMVADGQSVDTVTSYFGMRRISIEDGKLCLNNRPYKMKMVLDQGYFPDGILTPPSDDAIRRDVELTKELGFNGARKHQKLEDPRYLYWCDKLGLLVWSEAANAYEYSEEYVRRFVNEWQESIERDYSHPCIVAWVPLNESWGVPDIAFDARQQQHALTMVHLTKSLDPTRPVISNDGWEHVASDICTIHDYAWQREVLEQRYSSADTAVAALPANRRIYAHGFRYGGQPIHVSEFGGISFKKSEWEGWGYSGADNDEDFIERVYNVIDPLLRSPAVQGYCYTQLTDVEQEINGLLTYDRKPKVELAIIKRINEGKYERP